jgi:hypothetical protein
MFEHRSHPLLSRRAFLLRLGRSGACAAALLGACLGIGVIGYHFIEQMTWVDALLNASMILSGMGPVNPLHTTAGKLFASCYALLSGVAFISTMGILLAAPLHRLMHRFHLEAQSQHNRAALGHSRPDPGPTITATDDTRA